MLVLVYEELEQQRVRPVCSCVCALPGKSMWGKKMKNARQHAPPWVGSRSRMGWWFSLAPATLEFGFDSQTRGTREDRRTLCFIAHVLHYPLPHREQQLCERYCSNKQQHAFPITTCMSKKIGGQHTVPFPDEKKKYHDTIRNMIVASSHV